MKIFDELWKDIEERSQRWSIPIVQNKEELRHVFNLMKDCKSYLEVGSAEGNSLYILSSALIPNSVVKYIDYGEEHTKAPRNEILSYFYYTPALLGNSHSNEIIHQICSEQFDCVMIDAGHAYEDVIADAIAYGHLATKYIFFHDIQLPEVRKAFDWYCAQNPQFKRSEFINSTNYGYGILEV